MINIIHNNEFYKITHVSGIDGHVTEIAFADYQSDISKHVQNIIEILAAENIECWTESAE
jgi:hypothetical protein